MPRVRDLLDRFRPAGAPGAATIAGAPEDRAGKVTAELEPVFDLLADVEAECARLRQEAEEQARSRREHAASQAEAMVAAGRRDAEAERADAAARLRQRYEDEANAAESAATREAEEVHRRAEQRLPESVARVLATVRGGLAETAGRSPMSGRLPAAITGPSR